MASLKASKEKAIHPAVIQGVIDVVEDDITGIIENISTYQKIVDESFKEMEESTSDFNKELEELEKNTGKVVEETEEVVVETEKY